MPNPILDDLVAQVTLAHSDLASEFRSRPRLAPMSDRYCKLWNSCHYGLILARDVRDYGDPPDPAIRQLNRDLAKIRKFIQTLKNDPYVCRQSWRVQEWNAHYHVNK